MRSKGGQGRESGAQKMGQQVQGEGREDSWRPRACGLNQALLNVRMSQNLGVATGFTPRPGPCTWLRTGSASTHCPLSVCLLCALAR